MKTATGTHESESHTDDLENDQALQDEERELPDSSSPDEPLDDPASQAEETDAPEAEEPAKPDPKRKTKPESKLDPSLASAVDRLAGPDAKAKPAQTAVKPGTPPAKPAAQPAKPDAKPAQPSTQGKVDPKNDDPFAGLDSIKERTRERIQSLHGRARTAETALETAKGQLEPLGFKTIEDAVPYAQLGKRYQDTIEKHQLGSQLKFVNEHEFAGAIAASAAANRLAAAIEANGALDERDLAMLEPVRESIDEIFAAAGRPRADAAPSFEGDLPEDLGNLVQLEELSEEEARLVAGRRAQKAAAAKKPKASAQTQPAKKPVAPVREEQAAPSMQKPAARAQAPVNPVAEQAEARMRALIVKAGVEPDRIVGHFRENLIPIIDRLIAEEMPPGTRFEDVDPHYRVEYAQRAQQEFSEKARPRTREKPAKTTDGDDEQPLRANGRRAPRTAAGQEAETFLGSVVDHLAGD